MHDDLFPLMFYDTSSKLLTNASRNVATEWRFTIHNPILIFLPASASLHSLQSRSEYNIMSKTKLLLLSLVCQAAAFSSNRISPRSRTKISIDATSKRNGHEQDNKLIYTNVNVNVNVNANVNQSAAADALKLKRRPFLQTISAGLILLSNQEDCLAATASAPKLPIALSQVTEARQQMDAIPNLIKEQKWDSIRAVLATPPLSDTWTKTAKLLNGYAKAVGDEMPDGDELAALEFKEDVLDHMRFLDMAVYNNVFNPIRTEGESGATKELIRSYYEDPVSEYKACVRALDGLIELAK